MSFQRAKVRFFFLTHFLCSQRILQLSRQPHKRFQTHREAFVIDVYVAAFLLFVAGHRAEDSHALDAVFGGMLSLVGAQQADIFTSCLHYDWIYSDLQCKYRENIPTPQTQPNPLNMFQNDTQNR